MAPQVPILSPCLLLLLGVHITFREENASLLTASNAPGAQCSQTKLKFLVPESVSGFG